MDKLIGHFKPVLFIIVSILVLFIFLYIGAWFANGIWATHFDLPALINGFKAIWDYALLIIAKFGLDSWLNTNKGGSPEDKGDQ